MRYFWRGLLVFYGLVFWNDIIVAQPDIDTLTTCNRQIIDSLKRQDVSPIKSIIDIDVDKDNPRLVNVDYKLIDIAHNEKDEEVYIQLCVNNQFVTHASQGVSGDLGRIKGRDDTLRIQIDREIIDEPESILLYGLLLQPKKPPVQKWFWKSFRCFDWGHKQIRNFNKTEEELKEELEKRKAKKNSKIEGTTGFTPKKDKGKGKLRIPITYVLGGILVLGTLIKTTSDANYKKAKNYYDKGNTEIGYSFYKKANDQHKISLGLTGLGIALYFGNPFCVLKKGKKELKKYHKRYPEFKD